MNQSAQFTAATLQSPLPDDSLSDEALGDAPDPGPDSELRTLSVPPELHGQRLDRCLVSLVGEFSRSYLQQLVEAGSVAVSGLAVTKNSTKLRAGEVLAIELRPTAQSQAFAPEAMALDVVYEDAYLLVVNKPAGLVVHPAPGNWSGTLLNGLLERDASAATLPRAGIVHRLDKDTSGLMVVAKTRGAMDGLVQRIAARDVSRQYVALGHRTWRGEPSRQVDVAIGRDVRNRLRMAVVDLSQNSGKPASTLLKLLQNQESFCWVQANLHTGRTHQIRVHMAHLGHPLVADELYGGAPGLGLTRQALHALRLAFEHPITQEPMAFEVALPVDLQSAAQMAGFDV